MSDNQTTAFEPWGCRSCGNKAAAIYCCLEAPHLESGLMAGQLRAMWCSNAYRRADRPSCPASSHIRSASNLQSADGCC
jgi:hypothetical protein